MALIGLGAASDLSPQSAPKRTLTNYCFSSSPGLAASGGQSWERLAYRAVCAKYRETDKNPDGQHLAANLLLRVRDGQQSVN